MNKPLVLLILVLLLAAPARMPAPVVEQTETATPAAAEPEAPKRKHPAKAKTSESETPARAETRSAPTAPKLEGPTRFAGTWSGKINQGLLGHQPTSVTVDATATSIELNRNLGGGTRPVTITGSTLSWKTGLMGEVAWTLTPNADGSTAQVTMKGLVVQDSTTFRRGQAGGSVERSTSTVQSPPPPAKSTSPPTSSAAGGSMNGPRPQYSQAMRDAHLTGTGTYVLHFDTATGNVSDVAVTKSSGSAVLDQAAIAAFRQWNGPPKGPKEFPLTISFP
jgi:TonB family protein